MQARLEIRKLPSTLFAIVLSLCAAILIGAALGYALKPAVTINGTTTTRVLVVPASQVDPSLPQDSVCDIINRSQGC